MFIIDPSNPNRISYIIDTVQFKTNSSYAPFFVTVVAARDFNIKYTLPASIFVPISLDIQPIEGPQPTNVKFVQTYQNTYKDNWQLPYGKVKVSFTPPQSSSIVHYAIVNDSYPPESGKNTINASILRVSSGGPWILLKPSDAIKDPFYTNQYYYIVDRFMYRTVKAGIVALYSQDPYIFNIPASSYVPVNGNESGPAYTGPPIRVFQDCAGKIEIKDTTNSDFAPGVYIRNTIYGNDITNDWYMVPAKKFNNNILHVKLPPGINAQVTDMNGITIPVEGGPYDGVQEFSLCSSTNNHDTTMSISIQNTGITPTADPGGEKEQARVSMQSKIFAEAKAKADAIAAAEQRAIDKLKSETPALNAPTNVVARWGSRTKDRLTISLNTPDNANLPEFRDKVGGFKIQCWKDAGVTKGYDPVTDFAYNTSQITMTGGWCEGNDTHISVQASTSYPGGQYANKFSSVVPIGDYILSAEERAVEAAAAAAAAARVAAEKAAADAAAEVAADIAAGPMAPFRRECRAAQSNYPDGSQCGPFGPSGCSNCSTDYLRPAYEELFNKCSTECSAPYNDKLKAGETISHQDYKNYATCVMNSSNCHPTIKSTVLNVDKFKEACMDIKKTCWYGSSLSAGNPSGSRNYFDRNPWYDPIHGCNNSGYMGYKGIRIPFSGEYSGSIHDEPRGWTIKPNYNSESSFLGCMERKCPEGGCTCKGGLDPTGYSYDEYYPAPTTGVGYHQQATRM
jgi:hypothetical protein